jgi:hypothetical protein
MSSPTVRDLVVLTALALVARILAAWLVPSPPYVDAAYYTLVAERLAGGDGFSVPVLWSFLEVGGRLPAQPMLPLPSNGHWMPLTSIVAALPMLLVGADWRAGQAAMVILSTALVPLTYLIGWELWHSRWVAVPAALLAVFAGPLLVMYPLVESFAVFGVAGGGALYASLRAMRSARPAAWLIAAGALVGLATLARVDGLLLAVAPATAWFLRRQEGSVGIGAAIFSACAALLVMAPWLIRDMVVFGSPLPSAGGHTLWIRTYNEQFSIGHQPGPATWLAAGPWEIVLSRLASWGELLGRTLSLAGGLFGVTFLVGLWLNRGRRELAPFTVYWVVMFVTMGLVFTFHAPKGAFLHSAPAWLPVALPLAVASVAPAATAVARFWRFLGRPATHRFLVVAGLVGAVVVSLGSSAALLGLWRSDVQRLEAAAGYLRDAASPNDVVMTLDPARLYLLTGNPGVAPPFDPFDVVGTVVQVYDVRWVVVTLQGDETRDPLGLWDGAAGTDSQGNHPAFLPAEPAFEASGVRVYEVVH